MTGRAVLRCACRLPGIAELPSPAPQTFELCTNLRNQPNPLLIEKLTAVFDEPALIPQLQLRERVMAG